jgi:hypothetical protein
MGGYHEEEAPARCRLDRAGLWHRCHNHLSSRVRADCRISPVIFCIRFSAVDHNTPGLHLIVQRSLSRLIQRRSHRVELSIPLI